MRTIDKVYRPRLDEFIKELAKYPCTDYSGIPHPFLPEIGKNYRLALRRIAIIGKETHGWKPNLDKFIQNYQTEGFNFETEMAEFQKLDFKKANWMGGRPTRASFWGFWMNVLSKVYGIDNWTDIKSGKYDTILDSFAWGNVNAIETSTSSTVNTKALGYPRAKALSERLFDSIDMFVSATNPHGVILTCSNPERDRYLGSGFRFIECVNNRVSVFQRDKLIVLCMPHPRNQQCHYKGGAEEFARIVRDLFAKYKLFCPLPSIIKEELQPEVKQMFVRECMGLPKFDAIAKIAIGLRDQHAVMTARSLCLEILNRSGHTTNCGTPFTGNVWGPCRLVATAYKYFEKDKPDVAEDIALAFTDINGNYAYEKNNVDQND